MVEKSFDLIHLLYKTAKKAKEEEDMEEEGGVEAEKNNGQQNVDFNQ